jgi:intracellular sulfur oxidation DsrE/DsrF family protein
MCNNTKTAVEKREGHEITPLPGVQVVPSGAVRLMELQEAGWSYLHP